MKSMRKELLFLCSLVGKKEKRREFKQKNWSEKEKAVEAAEPALSESNNTDICSSPGYGNFLKDADEAMDIFP